MPPGGFFGTNNPTPWMNPGGNVPGLGIAGQTPQTLGTPPLTPAPAPAPQAAPASAPAPAPMPAPAATPAPAPMPFGSPGTGAFNNPTPWNALPNDQMMAIWQAWEAAGKPGGGLSPMAWYESGGYQQPAAGGGQPPQPPVPLGGQLGAMYGARFPGMPPSFSGTDAKGQSLFSFLPGRAGEAEGIGQFLANWLSGQATEQRPRSDEMENLFRMVQAQGANSPFLGLAGAAAGQAQDRISPDALADYESQLRTQAASDAGQGAQASMQRLRDAGMFGRGGVGVDPTLAASNLANQGLQKANLDISGIIEALTGNRLQQAGELARGGAGVQESMLNAPSYNLAQTLGQQKYGGDQPLLNLLQDMMYTSIQGDVASRSQPSGFEKIGVPLLSGAMKGASGIGDLLKVLGVG